MTLPKFILLSLCLALLLTAPVGAQDMRDASQKAARDRRASEEAAKASRERIFQDRKALLAEVNRLEAREKELRRTVEGLEESIELRMAEKETLTRDWAEKELEFREITGIVRVSARDLETLLGQSLFTAGRPERVNRVRPLLEKKYFPGIDDLIRMADLFLEEAEHSGEVSLKQGTFVDRAGRDQEGRILTLGKFTAAYDTGQEVGFLRYSEDSMRFSALPALPGWNVRRNLKRYLEGKEEAVYTDLSGGAALRQIIHKPGLWEQILEGGPIVWPILAIALLALILVTERILYLNRVHGDTDRIMARINEMADSGEWDRCEELVRKYEGRGWPVVNILSEGLASRDESRETQENILQEAILREAPRLERFLSTLGILGAVAPLLGLLGTVTGMIGTFRAITLYGTGDPKMMSGGISEALITTELGLAVAIPVMLVHTFLSRRVDHIIGEMEEKAVALTNITQKQRRQNGPPLQHA